MKNSGFTLIEMLIVLMVISVLLLLMVPNIKKNNEVIQMTGCEAMMKTVQAQVEAYKLENSGSVPTIDDLSEGDYIDGKTCPNGDSLLVDENGIVSKETT